MLAALVLAFAQPAHSALVADHEAVVVVALDASRSMQSTDASPRRIVAAQEQATRFVEGLPGKVRVGLVVFSGSATLAVPPTDNRGPVLTGIRAITIGDGTAIGEAI